MDEKIEQFRAVTNATLETAVHLLEACDGNLESAIDCFLQQNEAGLAAAIDQGGASSSSSTANNGAGPSAAAYGDDLVRAPIESKSGVLVDESFQRSYAPIQKRRQANSVFSKFRDFEAETKAKEESLFGSEASSSSKSTAVESKKKTLESLFRPPLEIMHRGTFETAKEAAISQGFWLLVNVQKTEEFACQALNRDVWKNSAVQEMIQSNFVFWQIHSDSADGQRFQTYYRVTQYPYVCVLDPRTGELLTTFKTNDSQIFCESVSNFLEQNSSFNSHDHASKAVFDEDPDPMGGSTATIPKNRYQSPPIEARIGLRNGGKRRLANGSSTNHGSESNGYHHDMDNFEEPKSKVVRMEDDDSSSGVSTSSSAASYVPRGAGAPSYTPSTFVEPKPQTIEGNLNPFDTPDIRLMFRLPDGTRRYLGASKHTSVKEILTYAERELQLFESSYDFVMNFPPRRLNEENGGKTLESLGVQKQEIIYVEEK